jgi:RNA polymerase sigma-70 factor (ECF subfamily)
VAERPQAFASTPAPRQLESAPRARFEELFASVITTAFGVALRYTRNQADAEDMVQEAALLAYRAFDSFETGTNFRAW